MLFQLGQFALEGVGQVDNNDCFFLRVLDLHRHLHETFSWGFVCEALAPVLYRESSEKAELLINTPQNTTG